LDKLKDSNKILNAEATKTMNNFLFSLTLEDIHEEIKAAIKDKNPLLRSNIV
jgi:hypothetical protein